jgi:hypothetical protein
MRFERVLKECRRRYVTRLSLPSATIFDGVRGRAAGEDQGWIGGRAHNNCARRGGRQGGRMGARAGETQVG